LTSFSSKPVPIVVIVIVSRRPSRRCHHRHRHRRRANFVAFVIDVAPSLPVAIIVIVVSRRAA
jgi:hypothetical protein